MDEHGGDRVIGGPGSDTGDRDEGDDVTSVEHFTPNVCFGG